jgi:hypothetical protein
MSYRRTLVAMFLALAVRPALGQEPTAKSRIVSVGLFKNGLAVIKREVIVPGAGAYRLDTGVEPVHGTFWLESNSQVEAAIKMREVDVPLHSSPFVNLQEDLAGKKVTIEFRSEKKLPVTGTILKLTPRSSDDPVDDRSQPHDRFYILQTERGRMYLNPGDIAAVTVDGDQNKTTQRRPVLVLTVEKAGKQPSIFVTYLTHGMAWAPSYLVDLTNPKSLSIDMAAVVRNEMADVEGAEFRLISGFPSVEFQNVLSPLSAHMTWGKFFQEVAQRGRSNDEAILSQQVVFSNSMRLVENRFKLGAIPQGEGVDLHFQSIGPRSLQKGEAFSLTVGKAKADYERIVEWNVGASAVSRKYGGSSSEKQQDEIWDAILYQNPFSFPMTTAPAMVVEKGQFNGQRTSSWANVGEETKLRITRSLSVRAMSLEQEDNRPNERVVVDDKNYTKIFLKGELTLNNHRKEPVKVHVHHTIRGAIQQIDAEPRLTTREESLQDVNRTQNADWVVVLQPGQEKKLTYKHSVLVYRP